MLLGFFFSSMKAIPVTKYIIAQTKCKVKDNAMIIFFIKNLTKRITIDIYQNMYVNTIVVFS